MCLFSVVIPVYNAENYLKKCIESILKQSFKDVEIILIDDGSTDKSGAICEAAAKKNKNIRVIHQKKNFGVARSRNAGIGAAVGEYIIFVDSDDYLFGGCLEKIAKLIKTKAGTDLIIGKFKCVPEKGGGYSLDHNYDKTAFSGNKPDRVVAHINVINRTGEAFSGVCWRYIIRRSFVKKNKIYFLPLKVHEDQVFAARVLCLAKSIALYNDLFYCYRTRPDSISRTINFDSSAACLEVIGEICRFMKAGRLSPPKKEFLYGRIKFALDLFSPCLGAHSRKEITGLSHVIEKHSGHIDVLATNSKGFDLYFFIRIFGAFCGLMLYKYFIVEKTISLVGNAEGKDVYIFCIGMSGRSAARILMNEGYAVRGFLDNNKAVHGARIMGLKVFSPAIFLAKSKKEKFKSFVLVCHQRKNIFEDILSKLKTLGLASSQVAWQSV